MKSFAPLIRSEWRLLTFGFVMTFGSSLGQTYFIALFGGEMRADLGISHGEFGAVYSAATLASALILLWSGGLIDRLDLQRFSLGIVGLLAVGCIVLANSYHLASLFIGILILRHLGQGLMGMTGTTTVVRYLDSARGKASAISTSGFSISEAILPSVIVALLSWLSWRQAWLACAAVLILVMPLAIVLLLREHRQRHAQYLEHMAGDGNAEQSDIQQRRQWTRAEMIRDPLFYLFLPALLAVPLLFTGFMFHQVHLATTKGWSLTLWGSLYVVYAIATSLTKILTGLLIDRYNAQMLVPVAIIPLGVGLAILSSDNHWLVGAGFMTCLGLAVGGYSTLASPFYSERYGSLHLGSIKSLTTALMVFSSALSPVLVGWGIDAGYSIDTLARLAVMYTGIAMALALWAAHSAQREQWT